MYDRRQISIGVGGLLLAWTLVGLLIVNSGVAVALPISDSGGFTIEADMFVATEAVSYPGEGESVEGTDIPAAVFELESTRLVGMTITKDIEMDDVPGLSGQMRIVIESDQVLQASGVTFKTNEMVADRAIWQGFIMDECRADNVFDQFVVTAGSDPSGREVELPGKCSPDLPAQIAGAGSSTAPENYGFLLDGGRIRAFSLVIDRVRLSNLEVTVRYDADGDGEFNELL